MEMNALKNGKVRRLPLGTAVRLVRGVGILITPVPGRKTPSKAQKLDFGRLFFRASRIGNMPYSHAVSCIPERAI